MGCLQSAPVDAAAGAPTSAPPSSAGSSSSATEAAKQKAIARIAEAQSGTASILTPSLIHIEKRYKMGKLLGKGAFGAVQFATRKEDGLEVGIKVISKMKFQGDQEYQYMLTEVQLHHKVRGHPNVTELYEYSEDKGNFYMVLECVARAVTRARSLPPALF
jgi:serine/threonine protein kinase